MNQIVKNTWPELVKEVMPQFNKIAVREKKVDWQAESQFAIQAIQKNKYLAECVPYTVQNAIINVAAVGLTLNPADGYAYLVPEYNKDLGHKECQLRISFKGLVKVATDTGAIAWVKAEVVKENDTFTYKGINELPEHIMTPFGDRGATVGVYCVAKTNEGEYLVDTISKAEIDQIRACAKFDAVWSQWYDEMAKKAVIKRASKQWPKTTSSDRLHKTIEVINEVEGSNESYLLYTPEQYAEFKRLFEEGDALGFFGFTDTFDGDVYGAMVNASKDEVRAEKGATQRGKDIQELLNKGRNQYSDLRLSIIDLAEDGDLDAVEERFKFAEEHGVKNMIKNSLNDSEKELLKTLKAAA